MNSVLKRKHIYFLFFSLLIVIYSCNNSKTLSPKDYIAWIENKDNGLKIQKEMDQIDYSIQYKSIDYIIVKEEKSNNIEKTTLESRRKVLEKMQYYTLRIASKNKSKDVLTVNLPSEQEYY